MFGVKVGLQYMQTNGELVSYEACPFENVEAAIARGRALLSKDESWRVVDKKSYVFHIENQKIIFPSPALQGA